MKLIIAGSRTITVQPFEMHAILNHFMLVGHVFEIVSGTAHGVDRSGELYAEDVKIPVTKFPANWEVHGRKAGFLRNKQMAEYADALLLIWDGSSPGSAMMKSLMEGLEKKIFEVVMPQEVSESIGQKVDYVKKQGQTRKHHCHWPGCDAQVPPAMWGCRAHWYKLPKYLRDRIWATYKPGQEVNMTPSKAYLKVADDVQKWIQENSK